MSEALPQAEIKFDKTKNLADKGKTENNAETGYALETDLQ